MFTFVDIVPPSQNERNYIISPLRLSQLKTLWLSPLRPWHGVGKPPTIHRQFASSHDWASPNRVYPRFSRFETGIILKPTVYTSYTHETCSSIFVKNTGARLSCLKAYKNQTRYWLFHVPRPVKILAGPLNFQPTFPSFWTSRWKDCGEFYTLPLFKFDYIIHTTSNAMCPSLFLYTSPQIQRHRRGFSRLFS